MGGGAGSALTLAGDGGLAPLAPLICFKLPKWLKTIMLLEEARYNVPLSEATLRTLTFILSSLSLKVCSLVSLLDDKKLVTFDDFEDGIKLLVLGLGLVCVGFFLGFSPRCLIAGSGDASAVFRPPLQ